MTTCPCKSQINELYHCKKCVIETMGMWRYFLCQWSDMWWHLKSPPIQHCSTTCSGKHWRMHQNSALLPPCGGNPPVTCGFTHKRDSNVESGSMLLSAAFIMWYNITGYWVHHCTDWVRMWIRVWIHKRHSIARPLGRDMGCVLWQFGRKLIVL